MIFNKQALAHSSLTLDLVQTPILLMYGTEKNVILHDRRSLATLEQEESTGRSDCRVVKKGVGNWMYCQRPDVCEKEIRKFLKGGNEMIEDDEKINLQSKLCVFDTQQNVCACIAPLHALSAG
mmetsp:Transcript_28620/g.61066  ORF Transcript_28620/g.61066 Transcript_28620/m.61066 type:complete len:123 (-) Transcript_28620:146-514(-)